MLIPCSGPPYTEPLTQYLHAGLQTTRHRTTHRSAQPPAGHECLYALCLRNWLLKAALWVSFTGSHSLSPPALDAMSCFSARAGSLLAQPRASQHSTQTASNIPHYVCRCAGRRIPETAQRYYKLSLWLPALVLLRRCRRRSCCILLGTLFNTALPADGGPSWHYCQRPWL